MPAGVALKKQLNVRVSDEAHAILNALRSIYGELSQSALLEVVLRESAKAHNISIPPAVTAWRMTVRGAPRPARRVRR